MATKEIHSRTAKTAVDRPCTKTSGLLMVHEGGLPLMPGCACSGQVDFMGEFHDVSAFRRGYRQKIEWIQGRLKMKTEIATGILSDDEAITWTTTASSVAPVGGQVACGRCGGARCWL